LPDKAEELTFERLYESYAEKILNLAYRMTADEEAARDLTQDIFIKVYENFPAFERRSHVYTWIYRIAVNHIYNYIKRERRFRYTSFLDKSISDIFHEDMVDPVLQSHLSAPSSERKMEADERAKLVWSMIQQLPAKYRVPLVLFHYEDMSYKEIAEAMGLSVSAVEARIHRARRQLIKKLEPWMESI
jgi:RNA polymerase sigma-70 factor (ECF subfamily)